MGNRLNGIVMGIFAKKKKSTLTIQEGLPDDIYKQAAKALGEGIINDDFSAFESMLDDNVKWEWKAGLQLLGVMKLLAIGRTGGSE